MKRITFWRDLMKDRDHSALITNIKVGYCIPVRGLNIVIDKAEVKFKFLTEILANKLTEEN